MLLLEVREFRDLTRWRWVLTDAASGALVADHEVRLNTADWQFEAFPDLPFYLRWHAAPDRRHEDEARLIGEVGEWIGSQVLGAVGPALLRSRPAVVCVVVPPKAVSQGAGDLLLRPLELAHVAGKPLAVQDVTLVLSLRADAVTPGPVGERLRVLGLFSLPEGKRSLNLRRERQELVRLIDRTAATGKAADVRVLQYGVTREALRDVLADGEGWDIVHISGHGRPGELLLETASGASDLVSGPDLADLLDAGRGRVKLVTVSACWSAASAAGEQRRLLGLPEAGNSRSDDDSRADAEAGTASGTLATLLASRLGCAVLAMRYPVVDEFAMALTGRLYELLVEKGQPLPRAVGMTLRELSATSAPALSVATLALFGDMAADLRLAVPRRTGSESYHAGLLKTGGFPPQAARFVGRTGVMARASAALAARSGVTGVLLHGMPGGGKTACALELAYGHEHAFDRLVWYKAPDEDMAIDGSLTDFALMLERYLPGFQMAHELVSSDWLAVLPGLTELMERRRALIVIDNLESLLSEGGSWRDDRWGLVIGALCGHHGLGRVVLTSRRVPAGLAGLQVLSVNALSADETLLLIRELPHLLALSQGKISGIDRLASRQLARRALEVAQGHPKLLELADGQATNPERLAALVEAGHQAWRKLGGPPEGFFADGSPAASGADFLQILAAWTKSVTDTLMPGERDLFWFLCCLEETDREWSILGGTWAGLWDRLGRDGQPPDLNQALTAIASAGLVSHPAGANSNSEPYAVHPGVAAAGRAHAFSDFRAAVDTEVAAYWKTVFRRASRDDGDGVVDTRLLVRAGLAAVPYLVRQEQWDEAATLLERAFNRAPSKANAAAVLPAIQQITRRDPRHAGKLALVLRGIHPAQAEDQMRAYLDAAVDSGNYRTAAVTGGRLMDLYRNTGRLEKALSIAEQMAGYTRQAGLGPWSQLVGEGRRLQILTVMGQASQVLTEVHRLLDHASTLPTTSGTDEIAFAWNVREILLDIGRDAARQLGRLDEALSLNAAQIASMHDRRAPVSDIARAMFNDYAPLLRLDRTDEALDRLLYCRGVFEDAHDTRMLGNTLSGLASVENKCGHRDAAIRLQRDALRYKYLAGDATGVAVSYHNLGNYLSSRAMQAAQAFACHLAAALIRTLANISRADNSVRDASTDLRELGDTVVLPVGVADLSRQVGDIPGTDLRGLTARLSPDPEVVEATLRDLIAQAQVIAAAPAGPAVR